MNVKLVFFKPNGERKDFPLTKPVTLIGRGEDCDLQVPLGSISRRHCEIHLRDEELRVDDLASSNGTYVNNQRVTTSPLKAGDRLVVGPVVLTVQIDGVPKDVQPLTTRGKVRAEVGRSEGEPVVDLEADVVETSRGDESGVVTLSDAGGEEMDPIEALEALAAEGDEEKEKEEQK